MAQAVSQPAVYAKRLRETSKIGIWEHSISLYGSSEWGTWQEGSFLKATSKALEIKHLSPWRCFIRGTWRGSSFTGDSKRHVMKGL
jgi:hypothetical protein